MQGVARVLLETKAERVFPAKSSWTMSLDEEIIFDIHIYAFSKNLESENRL